MKYRDTHNTIGDRLLIGIGVSAFSAVVFGTLGILWLLAKWIVIDWSNNWPYAVMISLPFWFYLIGWAIERTVLNYLEHGS
jgi:hypothetical protein